MSRKTKWLLGCGLAALISGAALQVSLSDEARAPAADFGASAADEDFAGPAPRKILPNASALRQRFVDLSSKRAQRMSDDELGQAIEQITKELGDQDAAAESELNKAVEQLKSVVERFPGTPSAERAGRAIEAMKTATPKRLSPPRISISDESEDDLSHASPAPPVKKPTKR